ncbi:nuclear receptor-binding factor 2-like isoform X2 [Pomacea canaliculata]|nr:nuclear receptor-binding factor 2-like isoform X2 [Pomacea canaliculata]
MQETTSPVVLESLQLQHAHHLSQATRLQKRQLLLEQLAARQNKAVALVGKVTQTENVSLISARREGRAERSLINRQDIHETLRETDTLLQFLYRKKENAEHNIPLASASSGSEMYREGIKMPKDDKVIIEELGATISELRGHIMQLMDELEVTRQEKDELAKCLRTKDKLLAESLFFDHSTSQNSAIFELPPLEMPKFDLLRPPPILDCDNEELQAVVHNKTATVGGQLK